MDLTDHDVGTSIYSLSLNRNIPGFKFNPYNDKLINVAMVEACMERTKKTPHPQPQLRWSD